MGVQPRQPSWRGDSTWNGKAPEETLQRLPGLPSWRRLPRHPQCPSCGYEPLWATRALAFSAIPTRPWPWAAQPTTGTDSSAPEPGASEVAQQLLPVAATPGSTHHWLLYSGVCRPMFNLNLPRPGPPSAALFLTKLGL